MDAVNVDIRIMAVKSRRNHVLEMLKDLNLDESHVVYDDRDAYGNAMYNARRTWLSEIPDGCTHRLVLEDDVQVCKNFTEIVGKSANYFPEAVWSYCCFRSKFEQRGEHGPYGEIPGCGVYGQAVMIPTKHVRPCFDWITETYDEDFPYSDCGIGLYCYHHEIRVLTTVPSLVQHLCPSNSTLGYNNKNKICKTWIGEDVSNEDWDNTDLFKTPFIANRLYSWKPKT